MASPQNDIILRGGTVVDGTGAAPFDADVRVRSGRIVEVGRSLTPEGQNGTSNFGGGGGHHGDGGYGGGHHDAGAGDN